MIGPGQIEVGLAAGYAGLLALIAVALEFVARHVHAHSRRYELAGFRYHPRLDSWECPAGEPLHRIHTDWERRVAIYRARAHVCNTCPLKSRCTDSDGGREVSHHMDSWLSSELRRFHRGISLVLLGLAALILLLEIGRHDSPSSLAVLLAVMVPVGILGVKTAADLRSR